MNAKQLNSFIRTAELKSFTKAAKEAKVSSPSLISQVNTLEKEYGYPLFIRNTHYLELTPQGEIFFRAAKNMLEVYNQFKQNVAKMADKQVLEIAFSEQENGQLQAFGDAFMERHPDVEIHFQVMDEEAASRALDSDMIQIWINTRQPDGSGWFGMKMKQDAQPMAEQFMKEYLSQQMVTGKEGSGAL